MASEAVTDWQVVATAVGATGGLAPDFFYSIRLEVPRSKVSVAVEMRRWVRPDPGWLAEKWHASGLPLSKMEGPINCDEIESGASEDHFELWAFE